LAGMPHQADLDEDRSHFADGSTRTPVRLHRQARIDENEAAARAINARTSNRMGAGWMQRKLKIARDAATIEAMRGYLRMFTTEAITADTHGLAAPMHVVNEAQDIAFYRGDASHSAFAAAYPAASYEVIDDAGHYSIPETPARVASIIEKRGAAAGR
jgi:3-oxoadipate enol-lactonase